MSSTASNEAGSRFNFVPLTFEDLPFLVEIRNECREFLHDNRAFNLEDSQKWFRVQQPDFWMIYHREVPIGYFRTSNHCRRNRTIVAGADLHRDFRGKGLGFLAWVAFLDTLFPLYDLYSVSLELLASNVRAFHLYQKLGFVVEGKRRGAVLRNGERIDSILMSILSSEWSSRVADI